MSALAHIAGASMAMGCFGSRRTRGADRGAFSIYFIGSILDGRCVLSIPFEPGDK